MILFCLEYAEDFFQFKSRITSLNYCEYRVCALSPVAAHYLEQDNFKFISIESLSSSDERYSIGMDNFELCEKVCDYLDSSQALKRLVKDKYNLPRIRLFNKHFVRVKMLLDNVSVCCFRVARLVESIQPGVMIIPRIRTRRLDPELFFWKNDSLYSRLLFLAGRECGVSTEYWSNQNSSSNTIEIKTKVKIVRQLLIGLKTKIKLLCYFFKLMTLNRPILITNNGYDFDVIIKNCSYVFFPLNWICKVKYSSNSNDTAEVLNSWGNDKTLRQWLSISGISYNKVVIEKFKEFLNVDIKCVTHRIDRFVSVLNRTKLVMFAAGPQNFFHSYLVEKLQEKNIKIGVLQHGAYGFARNEILDYSDFNFSGYFLSWGDGIRQMYDKTKKSNTVIMSVGSRKIESIHRQPKNNSKIIRKVFFLPHLARGHQNYWPLGPIDDIGFYFIQKKILRTMIKYKENYKLFLKLQVNPGNMLHACFPYELFYKKELGHITVKITPLEILIHECDLFLMDFPSTIFIQAIATGKPVISMNYKNHFYITEENKKLLPGNVILCETHEEFIKKIDETLAQKELKVNTCDHRFLRMFGIHKGNAEQNIVNAINSLIRDN